jgi:RNA:NAD 2'-phosphotransferase (TPT1/KptA family)
MLNINEAIERHEEHRDDMRLVRQYERRQLKLGKRLAYLLRYGAEKEGCRVDEGNVLIFENISKFSV